ncbi:hypothetical protein [Paenibacillus naphthalenovorans]|uniref:hypothetical protein n=1 Tax=Paenibacillus naphthalenovorans TaxID=162209 RepID=UPI000892745F|nr:hypothetical protein [Paenibacillus naphthalenovorans]SDJ82808.1 hypothetical protein SAMN05421868_14713 [Paenibacillus naphthalenovorans]
MLNKWLVEKQRSSNSYSFNVIDTTELSQLDDKVRKYIAHYLLTNFRDPEFLINKYKNRSKEELKKYLKTKVFATNVDKPSKVTQQGDWGEVLSALVLNDFRNVKPLTKLRWKVNNERSMFGTDVFALEEDQNGNVTKLIYCEVKTKRTYTKNIASQAYESLYRDKGRSLPDIIDFMSRIYFDKKDFETANKLDELYHNYKKYNKEFQIFLIYEKSKWKEDILAVLDSLPPKLKNLHITVVLINNLNSIISETYKETIDVGVEIVHGIKTVSTP